MSTAIDARIEQLEENIVVWQARANRTEDPERKTSIEDGIQRDRDEIAELEAGRKPTAAVDVEAQARAQVVEAAKARAYQVKAENEIAQAAAEISKVEGVTPETVMLQDPDAVLAVLADQSS